MEEENSFSRWFHILRILLGFGISSGYFLVKAKREWSDPVSSSLAILFACVAFAVAIVWILRSYPKLRIGSDRKLRFFVLTSFLFFVLFFLFEIIQNKYRFLNILNKEYFASNPFFEFAIFSIVLTFSSFLEIKILESVFGKSLPSESKRNAVLLSILPCLTVFVADHEWTRSIARGLKILEDGSEDLVKGQDLTSAFAFFFWHLNIGFYAVRLFESKTYSKPFVDREIGERIN
jgi:hypothetical protein